MKDSEIEYDDTKVEPLTEMAQEAMRLAEAGAEARREKHAREDVAVAQRAQSKPPGSSGVRVQADGKMLPEFQRAVANLTAHLIPVHEIGQQSRVDAAQAAVTMVQEMRLETTEERKKRFEDSMWYVRCQRCSGPGIWMFKRQGPLGENDWSTSYKPRGIMWPSKTVWCQCCYAFKGAKVKLKILHHSTEQGDVLSIRPYPRMIEEISKSEFERLCGRSADEPQTADAGVA